MTREEYKMIQKLLDGFYHDHLSNDCYNLIHDIKSELGLLYSTKLAYKKCWEILGYNYDDLLKVAMLLHENHIKPEQLRNNMESFQCGFDYCNKLSNEAFNKYFSKLMESYVQDKGEENEKE